MMQETFGLNSPITYTHLASILLIATGITNTQVTPYISREYITEQSKKTPEQLLQKLETITHEIKFFSQMKALRESLKQHWDLRCPLKDLTLPRTERTREEILPELREQFNRLQSRYHVFRRFILGFFKIKMYGPEYTKLCTLLDELESANNKLVMLEIVPDKK